MASVYGITIFAFGLLVPTILLNAPLLAGLLAMRHRIQPRLASWLVASGFVAAGAWRMRQMEWYDSWRYGMPSLTYLATGYLPYLLALGFTGWLLGRLIVRHRRFGCQP